MKSHAASRKYIEFQNISVSFLRFLHLFDFGCGFIGEFYFHEKEASSRWVSFGIEVSGADSSVTMISVYPSKSMVVSVDLNVQSVSSCCSVPRFIVEKGLNLINQTTYEYPSFGSGSVAFKFSSYAPFSKYREAEPFTLESKGSVRFVSPLNFVTNMLADKNGVIAVPKNNIASISGIEADIIFLLDTMVWMI